MLKKKIQPIIIFLGLSLLVHFSFMLSVWLGSGPHQKKSEIVEISYLDGQDFQKHLNKQIVDQAEQINDEVDEKAKYLSAFDQKVLEETQAQNTGKFQNTAGGGKPSEKQQEKPKEVGEIPSLKQLTPSFKAQSQHQGQGPNDDEMSQSDDHLKEVKSGLQTLLSTKEFVYYSYYSRIKEQIRQHWEPGVREKVKIIYKQGRNIASVRDRVTQVLVTLDKEGTLIRVDVLSPSGIVDLDAAAREAFEAAAPFPNPPQGMVEADGTIKIRWDFVLEA